MDDIFIQFKETFVEEALSLCKGLEKSLMQLENNSTDREAIQEVFRFAHTLKGVSAMYGFDKIAEYTHKLESLFDCIRNNTIEANTAIIDLTLQSADHIRNLLLDFEFINPENQQKHSMLLENIKIYVSDKYESPQKKSVPQKNQKKLGSYYISFTPDEEIIYRGIRIINLFRELAEIGTFQIFKHQPGIVTEGESENSESWGIFLSTEEPKETIDDIFIFVEDKYKIFKLSDNNLFDNTPESETYPPDIKSIPLHIEDLLELKQTDIKEIITQRTEVQQSNSNQLSEKQTNETSNAPEIVSHHISVDTAKLDTLMYLVSELVTTNAQLKMGFKLSDRRQMEMVVEKMEKLTKQFRDSTFSLRLIPIQENILCFQRLIRDLSHSLHKQIKFEITGGETELDKSILDKLTEPFMHLVRNCIDHGIELPETRLQMGKSQSGTIKFSAQHSGNHIFIRISDDGCGIDEQKVLAKAIEKGIVEKGKQLSKQQIYDVIFLPGFSTAESLSEISGRGVGMDVVKRKIQELHGDIQIVSEKNIGTTFIIKLQQTVSIVDTLLIRCGTSFFAIPLAEIENCQLPANKAFMDRQNKHIDYMNQLVPYTNLREEFQCYSKNEERQKIVIINRNEQKHAIVTDEIIGEYQAVIKPLGKVFSNIHCIYGASILGSGKIALLIDTDKLINNQLLN